MDDSGGSGDEMESVSKDPQALKAEQEYMVVNHGGHLSLGSQLGLVQPHLLMQHPSYLGMSLLNHQLLQPFIQSEISHSSQNTGVPMNPDEQDERHMYPGVEEPNVYRKLMYEAGSEQRDHIMTYQDLTGARTTAELQTRPTHQVSDDTIQTESYSTNNEMTNERHDSPVSNEGSPRKEEIMDTTEEEINPLEDEEHPTKRVRLSSSSSSTPGDYDDSTPVVLSPTVCSVSRTKLHPLKVSIEGH